MRDDKDLLEAARSLEPGKALGSMEDGFMIMKGPTEAQLKASETERAKTDIRQAAKIIFDLHPETRRLEVVMTDDGEITVSGPQYVVVRRQHIADSSDDDDLPF